MENFKRRPILELRIGEEITCNASAGKSSAEKTQGITCIGKLDDGRIVLFDKQASLSRVIKLGDKIRGKIVHVKPTYVIILPESIVEQSTNSPAKGALINSRWDSSLIETIRRKKEAERNPDLEYLLKLISKELYGGEKTHYILELIQNADDESAKGLSFTAHEDRVEVWNDGEAFTSEDVENICSARSAKRNKIGFFGVGFKSVFNITDKPQIISGKYNFQLEDFIYPTPCFTKPPPDFSPEKGAWFILPYNDKNRNVGKIESIMQAINEKALLFLPHLKEIDFTNTVSGNKWYLEKTENGEGIVSLFNSSTNAHSQWRVFTKDLEVPAPFQVVDADAIKQRPRKTRIAVAFPVPDNGKMLDVSAEPIYCYLPTQKRTDMPFLIQGDFDPTVGRENIKDDEWNQWLLEQVGKLAAEGYEATKDQVSHETLFRYIPLDEEVKEHLLRIVYDNLLKEIKTLSIAPTTDNKWVLPTKIVIDLADGELLKLIGADITELKGEGVGYLALSAGERGRSVLAQLDAQKIMTDDLIAYVQRTDLIEKRLLRGPDWFLELYVYFSKEFNDFTQENIQNDQEARDKLEKLKSSKIIVTARDKLISIKSDQAREIVIFYPHKINLDEEYAAFSDGEVDFINHYFQKDTTLRRKSVDQDLEEVRERARAFLTLLGVRLYYDEYTLTNEVICNRLQKPEDIPLDKIIAYTNFVLEKLDRYVSLAGSKYQTSKTEEQILENLGNKLNVCVINSGETNQTAKYVKASEAHFSKYYGFEALEELFSGLPGIPLLSDIYIKPGEQKKWREFFEKLGVWKSPKVVKLEETRIHPYDSKYSWVPFTSGAFYGTHSLEGDWVSPDLEQLFELSKSQSDESNLERFNQLWKMLDDNWTKTYQKARSCTYAYTPVSRSQTKKVDNTSFLNMLLTSRWVPASDGSISEAPKLFTDTERNRTLLGDSVKYVALQGRQSFIKDLNIKENPTKAEVVNHLKQLKSDGVEYTKDTLGKLETIFSLLVTSPDQPSGGELEETQETTKMIHDDELVYIPRKDKEWWSPEKVFWKDQNSIFGKTRGYLSTFYSRGAIPTFEKLGIKEAGDLNDCLKVLEELASSTEIDDTTKAIINSIYLECERLIGIGIPDRENQNFQNLKLLVKPKSEKQTFVPVAQVVYSDNDMIESNFADVLEVLWLGCAYSEVPNLLSALKISPISSLVDIEVKPLDVVDAKLTTVQTIRDWQIFLNQWIKYRKPKLYQTLSEGIKRLGTIDILEAQEIALHLNLKTDPNIGKIIESDVYYDNLTNKLYYSAVTSPYAPKVASELCRIFSCSEVMKEPILNLSSAGEDTERRIEIFQQFGIPKEGLPNLVMEQIEAKQMQEQKPTKQAKPTPPKEEPKKEEPKAPVNIPTQQTVQLGPFLIDPEQYLPDEIGELEPTATPENEEKNKTIVRAVTKAGPVTRQRTVKVTIAPQLPEDVGLNLIKKFEQSEGRTVDDSARNQKNVGYDFTSTDGKSKRFAEMKASRYDDIDIPLQQSEWRKAELEGDNYYIYIITGLREGSTPKLRILQNPIKHLKPDLPSNITISKWKHAVRYVVTFSKTQDLQTIVESKPVDQDEK